MEPELTYMDNLILSGALEVAGIGEDGKFTYTFTDKLEEIDPELKQRMEQGFYEAMMYLWTEGFLELTPSEDSDAKITITTKALDNSAVSELSNYYQKTLMIIIEALKK